MWQPYVKLVTGFLFCETLELLFPIHKQWVCEIGHCFSQFTHNIGILCFL